MSVRVAREIVAVHHLRAEKSSWKAVNQRMDDCRGGNLRALREGSSLRASKYGPRTGAKKAGGLWAPRP